MKKRRCPQCAAALPHDPNGTTLQCIYCGTSVEVRPTRIPHTPRVESDTTPESPPTRRPISFMRLFPILMIGLGVGLPFYLGGLHKVIWSALAHKPSSLADLDQAFHLEVDLAPPPGGYASVEPLQALPWALGAAQSWRGDATLQEVRFSRLRPDGTLDANHDLDARLVYVFISPALLDRNERLRAQGGKEVSDSLELLVRGGTLHATISKFIIPPKKLPPNLPNATKTLVQYRGGPLGEGNPFLDGRLEFSHEQQSWIARAGGSAFRLRSR